MGKKATIITLSVTLGVTIATLMTALIIFITTSTTYANQLENVYKRSFYELSSNLNDIEIDLSKLVATTDLDAQKEILTDIFNTCTLANTNISNIPVSSQNIKDVTHFVNRLSGFCYSLITKINGKIDFTDQDISSISELHTHALNLLFEIDAYSKNMTASYSFVKQMDFKNEDSGLSQTFGSIQTTTSKVPTLIYDGPFADSVLKPDIKGLPSGIITEAKAREIVETKLTKYQIKSVKYKEQSKGLFTTFNYEVDTNTGLKLFVQVTEQGGVILEITSIGTGGDKKLTETESVDLAKQFAISLGYNDLYNVWSTKSGDIAYVNLAPIINRVIYYPDLIKVKIDTKLGLVTGWEAKNYIYNHSGERTMTTPKITITEGEKKLSNLLKVVEKNTALIPIEFGEEKLSYEYVCTWKNYTYYIYLDVETGKELNILRVLKTAKGDLVI